MKRYFDHMRWHIENFICDWETDVSQLESYRERPGYSDDGRYYSDDYDSDELFQRQAQEVYDAVRVDGFYNVFHGLPERWEKLLDDDSEKADKILNRANQVILNIIEKWI